ncbi:MAG TPA: hypothetical protein VK622_07810, partial [Puia sp.]|nr:hypothetical protein [Puia sp.]
EVILSLKLKQDLTKSNAKKDNTPIQLIEKHKIFRSNVNSLSIQPVVRKNNKVFDVSENDTITVVEIHIDDTELAQLVASGQHPFHRIDGNHRLSAAEQIEENDRIKVMNIPFCIVLFEELTSEEFVPGKGLIKTVDDSFEKFERVVFYNINSKSIPLTVEENLRGIIGEDKYFDVSEIDTIFFGNGSIARKLGNRINYNDFSALANTIKDNKWAMCLKVLQLYDEGIEAESDLKVYAEYDSMVSDLFEALQDINTLYKDTKPLSNNPSIEVLITFLYYKTFCLADKFSYFARWIIKNHLFEAQETTAKSIIKIFDSIYLRKTYPVFVAMPYWSDAKVNEYNKLFKEVLKDVQMQSQSNIILELIPIMRFKGKSQRIDQRLLESIRNCEIFIADVTECNPNVLYEVAFAEGCNKPSILIKGNKDKAKLPFDMDKRQYIPYDATVYYSDIKTKVTNQLKAILTEEFKMFI